LDIEVEEKGCPSTVEVGRRVKMNRVAKFHHGVEVKRRDKRLSGFWL